VIGDLAARLAGGSLVVVVAQPSGQVGRAGVGAAVPQCVGPLAEQGLDEPLGLAVGVGRVRPGADVAHTQQPAGLAEQAGEVARAVVGHHPLDPDAEALKKEQGADQEAGDRQAPLVGQGLDVRQARGSSTATWTNSQPAPAEPWRRSPVILWPTWRKRASHLRLVRVLTANALATATTLHPPRARGAPSRLDQTARTGIPGGVHPGRSPAAGDGSQQPPARPQPDEQPPWKAHLVKVPQPWQPHP
jgi:hypothetical protein